MHASFKERAFRDAYAKSLASDYGRLRLQKAGAVSDDAAIVTRQELVDNRSVPVVRRVPGLCAPNVLNPAVLNKSVLT
jgi:hypothetical protein